MKFPSRRPTAPPPDLLAQADAEAFDSSVRAYFAGRGQEPEQRKEAEPEAEVEWEEQEAGLYRPEPLPFAEAVRRLGISAPQTPPSGQVYITIALEAFSALKAHLRSDTAVELGGLLAGQVFHDAGTGVYVVFAEQALAAREGEGTAVSFSYTTESWAAILPGLQALPPGRTIVGSYHSHPGLGVFLSRTDLETQAAVFPHPWQIALVVDPVADTLGFFAGVEGRECTGWAVTDRA